MRLKGLQFNAQSRLTAEVEVDGGCDLAILVLGPDFVESCVCLDHVVELEDDLEGLLVGGRHLDRRARVLANLLVFAEPEHLWLGVTAKLALEDKLVAVILLPKL